jgi:hypothetical protein
VRTAQIGAEGKVANPYFSAHVHDKGSSWKAHSFQVGYTRSTKYFVRVSSYHYGQVNQIFVIDDRHRYNLNPFEVTPDCPWLPDQAAGETHDPAGSHVPSTTTAR